MFILAETSPDIKHYVIKTQRASRKSIFQSKKKLPLEYFIGHSKFNSLQELIERYQQEQGGLCCRLAKSSAERNDYLNTVHFIYFLTVHFSSFWIDHFMSFWTDQFMSLWTLRVMILWTVHFIVYWTVHFIIYWTVHFHS